MHLGSGKKSVLTASGGFGKSEGGGFFPHHCPDHLGGDRGSYTHIMLGGATRAESQNCSKGAKKRWAEKSTKTGHKQPTRSRYLPIRVIRRQVLVRDG